MTNFATRTVTIAGHLGAAQAAKTLAHDIDHTAHDGTEYATSCRGRAEIEAESVAYSLIWTGGPR